MDMETFTCGAWLCHIEGSCHGHCSICISQSLIKTNCRFSADPQHDCHSNRQQLTGTTVISIA